MRGALARAFAVTNQLRTEEDPLDPAWLGRLVAGEAGISVMTQIRGCSNAKAKAELGWSPPGRAGGRGSGTG